MNKIQEQLEKARPGIARETDFLTCLSRFMNTDGRDRVLTVTLDKYLQSGGTFERAHYLLEARRPAAIETGERGQRLTAEQGQSSCADLPHQTPSGGQRPDAEQGHSSFAEAGDPTPSGGQSSSAEQGHAWIADTRPQTPSGGQMATADEGQTVIAEAGDGTPSGSQERSADEGQTLDADARHQTPSGGHSIRADEGHGNSAETGDPIAGEASTAMPEQGQRMRAETRDPIPDEGQGELAEQSQITHAETGEPVNTEGQRSSAEQGHGSHAPVVHGQDPTAAEWERREQQQAELSYWAMIKLRGRGWNVWRYKDLRNLRTVNHRENMAIDEALEFARNNRIDEGKLVCRTMPMIIMKGIQRRSARALPPAPAKVLHKKPGRDIHAPRR